MRRRAEHERKVHRADFWRGDVTGVWPPRFGKGRKCKESGTMWNISQFASQILSCALGPAFMRNATGV